MTLKYTQSHHNWWY